MIVLKKYFVSPEKNTINREQRGKGIEPKE